MKDFETELTTDPKTTITHWHTYPRTPKMNAHAERFNRTIQEEFVQFHQELLFSNLPLFNKKLNDYISWYNTKRPHFALGLKTPKQVLAEYNKQQECNM